MGLLIGIQISRALFVAMFLAVIEPHQCPTPKSFFNEVFTVHRSKDVPTRLYFKYSITISYEKQIASFLFLFP